VFFLTQAKRITYGKHFQVYWLEKANPAMPADAASWCKTHWKWRHFTTHTVCHWLVKNGLRRTLRK